MMRPIAKTLFPIATAALFCVSALAAPAPWHLWRSKLNDDTVCAQSSPGDGWEKAAGPFRDARCTLEGMPGR